MYADKIVAAAKKRSVKDRLGGDLDEYSGYGARRSNNKRQRSSGDDKWKHDLYEEEDGEMQQNGRAVEHDLRAKLQQKNSSKNAALNAGHARVRDLRERLSGPNQPRSSNTENVRRITSVIKSNNSTRSASASKPAVQPAALPPLSPAKAPSKTLQRQPSPLLLKRMCMRDFPNLTLHWFARAQSRSIYVQVLNQCLYEASEIEGLLQSLDLEKYIITFKAEEVDMTALKHMGDDDLRSLGIPMGPRKKILLALDSQIKR